MSRQVIDKTKFIVLDVQDEFYTKWCGRMIDSKPVFENDKPIFIIVGSHCRLELNTFDIKYVEKMARKITCPKGRQAVTSDSARIYIKEDSDNEMLLAVVFHTRAKTFAPVIEKNKEEN